MAIAEFADALPVSRDWRHGSRGRADHRFRDEGDDRFRALAQDFLLERFRNSLTIGLGALARLGEAIFEAWIGQRDVEGVEALLPEAAEGHCDSGAGGGAG